MRMSEAFATAVTVVIPVLIVAGIVELRRHRETFDAAVNRARDLLTDRSTVPESETQPLSGPSWQAQLEATSKDLKETSSLLVFGLVTGLASIASVAGALWWLSGEHGPDPGLAWLCIVDAVLCLIFIVWHPTKTLTSGMTSKADDQPSALDLLQGDIKKALAESGAVPEEQKGPWT